MDVDVYNPGLSISLSVSVAEAKFIAETLLEAFDWEGVSRGYAYRETLTEEEAMVVLSTLQAAFEVG